MRAFVFRPAGCLVLLVLALARPPAAQEPPPLPPENLVLDLRIFEARSGSPDLPAMHQLNFYIATDGLGVTARQWLATLANKIPDSYLAALAWETLALEEGVARFRLPNGPRSFDTEIRLASFHPSAAFKAEVKVRMLRGDQPLREFDRSLDLELGKTIVWCSQDLQVSPTDYLSHFREFESLEHRGLLFEQFRRYSLFLVMAVTPRLRTAEEAALEPAESLSLPPGTELPDLDSSLGVPLKGTLVLGFEIDPSGQPLNPQVLRSTLPEANPRLLGEVSKWRFPPPANGSGAKRQGRLELKLRIP